MDEKLTAVLHKVIQLSKQNPEFNAELRKELGITPSASVTSIDDDKMRQIYEHCIQQILKKQAEEFYKDFPIESIVPMLVSDYIRMEAFRRSDNFGDFCLALYQQIENMTNYLCNRNDLNEIAEKMWAAPAYIKVGKNITPSLENRSESNFIIAKLVLKGKDDKYVEKSQSPLRAQTALDKIRSIVYFLGYKGMMRYTDYDDFKSITDSLSDIYQCRNLNHRGNPLDNWAQKIYDRIIPLKSFHYLKFLGVLTQYVTFICDGLSVIETLHNYAKGLSHKKGSA